MTLSTAGLNGVAATNVKIGGGDAWRVGDHHMCTMQNQIAGTPPVPVRHVGGWVLKGSFTDLIGSRPAVGAMDTGIKPASAVGLPVGPFPPGPNNTIQIGETMELIGDVGFVLVGPAVLDWGPISVRPVVDLRLAYGQSSVVSGRISGLRLKSTQAP